MIIWFSVSGVNILMCMVIGWFGVFGWVYIEKIAKYGKLQF